MIKNVDRPWAWPVALWAKEQATQHQAKKGPFSGPKCYAVNNLGLFSEYLFEEQFLGTFFLPIFLLARLLLIFAIYFCFVFASSLETPPEGI